MCFSIKAAKAEEIPRALKFFAKLVGCQRTMCMIAARRQRRTVVSKVKLFLSFRKSVDVETQGVEIICQVIRRKEIDGRGETGFGTNFQQALEHFKWCKTANRISVGCHICQRLLCNFSRQPAKATD